MLARFKRIVFSRSSNSVEGRLRSYIGVSDKITALGFFSVIFGIKFNLKNHFPSAVGDIPGTLVDRSFWTTILGEIAEEWEAMILFAFTVGWYFLYKRAVANEMGVLVRLYSAFNPPHDWEKLIGRRLVPYLSVGLTFGFIALAWFVDDIRAYCVFVVLLNIMDIVGNSSLRMNLAAHFRDERYVPHPDDLHRAFILRRRAVAQAYWIDRPQIERIGFMMIAVMVAFIVSDFEAVLGSAAWQVVSYLVLIVAIATNELVMVQWRLVRDEELDRIDDEQETEDRERAARVGGAPGASPAPSPSSGT